MRTRCNNPNFTFYARYGAIGIKVCDRWNSFENFLADMGERPSLDYSIDRHPNKDGNYEPGNCRWATRHQQSLNRKSTRPVRRSDGKIFPSLLEAAENTAGAHRKCIWDVCNGKQSTHRGFGWEYIT
jgi:hypothetical protein